MTQDEAKIVKLEAVLKDAFDLIALIERRISDASYHEREYSWRHER